MKDKVTSDDMDDSSYSSFYSSFLRTDESSEGEKRFEVNPQNY